MIVDDSRREAWLAMQQEAQKRARPGGNEPELPLFGGGGGGISGGMSDGQPEAPWEARISRLEMGFCGAFVLIFAAIIASYLMLAGKIDDNGDKIANAITAQADTRGDIKVLNERTANMDKKLDSISAKLDHK